MANRPQRLRDFSYVGQHRYFLTICVKERAPVFTNDSVARFVIAQFLLCANVHGFEVLAYCAMPDHFHALVIGLTDTSDLRALLHAFKRDTSYWWKQQGPNGSLWQEGFHDRVLREHDVNEAVIRYILMNPVRARIVADPRDYPYLGAEKYDVPTLLESSFLWTPPWK